MQRFGDHHQIPFNHLHEDFFTRIATPLLYDLQLLYYPQLHQPFHHFTSLQKQTKHSHLRKQAKEAEAKTEKGKARKRGETQ